MKYAYQRQGGPLLSWNRAPPQQTRAADAKSLGSLGGDTLGAMELPRAGAPEPIGGLGCGCGMGAEPTVAEVVASTRPPAPPPPTPGVSAAIGDVIRDNKFIIGLFASMFFYNKFLKKRR